MQELGENSQTEEPDTDADPGTLNPRDLRDVESGDGARDEAGEPGQDPDADPEALNPRPDQP